MAVCDKWVALKIIEFLVCVACVITKRISSDDEARVGLLLQKLSREWSLLNSVTWDSIGGAFADAVYGGYLIITFGLILARIFNEIPKGRRILESFLLGFGMLFFIVLGGLVFASLDSIPNKLVTNAAVLGSLSLLEAALFLIDLMAPRIYTSDHNSQTDIISSPKTEKNVTIVPVTLNGHIPNEKQNGHVKPVTPKDLEIDKIVTGYKADRPTDLNIEKIEKGYKETSLFDEPDITKYDTNLEYQLEKSKFGSLRTSLEMGNYVRLDPLAEPYRSHYEKELAKFNERYFRDYLEGAEPVPTEQERLSVKENYLPEPQTPVFAKVRTGRTQSLFDDMSQNYESKRSPSKSPSRIKTVSSPTLQQLEDYLRSGSRTRRSETPALFPMEPIEEKDREGAEIDRASGTPTDPGFVQYTAKKWPDKRELKTPRHSPTE